jgi:hypothetical protein
MGSILSSFGVPNSMIPEILAAAEKIMMSDTGALSAGVFLCGICSNNRVRTTSVTTSRWHAISNGVISHLKSLPLGILITICVRFQYQDLCYLWCEAIKELLELNTRTQWLGSDGATIVYWRFQKKDWFLRKQVGLFADQVLVGAVGRAFGAWTAAITGTERRVDMLNKDMVQFALLQFDKNLTLDHLDHHTEYLYPYRRGKDLGAHFKVCKLKLAKTIRTQKIRIRRSSRIPRLDRQGHLGVTVIWFVHSLLFY